MIKNDSEMLNNAYCSDKYQYTMGKSFYDSGMKDMTAVFNLFYRKAPENNNWAVVSGTDEIIEMIDGLGRMEPSFFEKFLPGEEYAEFRSYLSTMKFTGRVYAMREGEIVFPNQPIIIVEGPLIEAADDLGANAWNKLRRVILPMSLPGVVSGIIMVFVPSISTFYISQKLGGGTFELIGDTIERQFQNPLTYNVGAAISLVMMILLLISIAVMNRFADDENEGRILP